MEELRESITVYFDIEKQNVVLILKCRKNDEKAVENALRTIVRDLLSMNEYSMFPILKNVCNKDSSEISRWFRLIVSSFFSQYSQ